MTITDKLAQALPALPEPRNFILAPTIALTQSREEAERLWCRSKCQGSFIEQYTVDQIASVQAEAYALGQADALAEYDSAPSAPVVDAAAERCQPDGLKFDAFGEPRTRYVRVSLENDHCVMHPSEGDSYLKDAREWGDESPYVVRDVWLSEREFDDLPEHNGF